MNYEQMSDTGLIEEINRTLFDGGEDQFRQMLIKMKEAGVARKRIYSCMMEVWRRLDTKEHDKQITELREWLDFVGGTGIPVNPIWEGPFDA